MKVKTLLITGLAVAMLGISALPAQESFAKESPKIAQTSIVKKKVTHKEIAAMANEWVKKQTYVQNGGNYENGEYRSFEYKGSYYRYLSKDIDTNKELMAYLNESVTPAYAKRFIKEKGILEYKGKMAQPEADGGTLLQWDKAIVKFDEVSGKERVYTLLVPVGETEEVSAYKLSANYLPKHGWKISKLDYSHTINLNVPGNINPAFVFFKYLLIDTSISEDQLIKKSLLNVDKFKKGITKVEFRNMEEGTRKDDLVDFKVTIYVELAKNYKGKLKSGLNQLTFTIRNTGEMQYKIADIKM
ncbi:DL-endopeptidase inhibitor IseA family protein [Bacillus sp. JJ1609]|uniref:DL-endopeptidase inhibitor IseA family protein n=1 Tax=Bacillus sp. JJ1609 TaxID=3122977 RepID=UPI00300049FF